MAELASESSIQRILGMVEASVASAGVPVTYLSQYTVEALGETFSTLFHEQKASPPGFRDPVDVVSLQGELARRIAGAVIAQRNQAQRLSRFIVDGPPPGPSEFPIYTRNGKYKSIELNPALMPYSPWGSRSAQEDYMSFLRSCGRRPQSCRSKDTSGVPGGAIDPYCRGP